MEPQDTTATVCVVGAGPAGAMLALLLARSGVDVVLLEKHADFLRDFRGDTVHPSTLEILDELGLAGRFHELPHRKLETMGLVQDGRPMLIADFRALGLRFPYVVFVPQWDFLNLITAEAARYPGFRLWTRAEVTGLLRADGRAVGVRCRTPDGERTVRAALVVAADGRKSVLRAAAGLRPRDRGVRMDVLMFRVSRRDDDPDERLTVRIGNGRVFVIVDRGTYWQVSYEMSAGGYDRLRREGVGRLRRDLAELVPFLADRTTEVTGLEELPLLQVRVDRLRRWYAPGLLFIGDAAHAMSPAGGYGVNLAVQDATAAANLLAGPLLEARRTGRPPDDRALARVQRRRQVPTVLTQEFQRLFHRVAVDRALRGDRVMGGAGRLSSTFERWPFLLRLLSRMTGVGLRPEHVRTPDAGERDGG
ncbi:FAD-dependent oxidoreductase [Streptomyces sp. NBC_01803]|uniref:FAD-dependent oxidoreductase n=1 Tax=Streptomyces sp. NBC_01803 TaxID=2975946 RepID=UPI002DD8C44B|nr:FAD-dependent oxidoreductase [Streptomyces sp. NBC_01803]WSA42869.1 FAD-dependent oxidoreductase [Streptomyces sp. NBC_01803]